MRKVLAYIIPGLLTIGLVAASCTRELKPDEYIRWIENSDNDLKQKSTTAAASYTIQYEPTIYKALKAMDADKLKAMKLNKKKQQFSSLHHFLLQVQPNSEAMKNRELTEYLAYDFVDKLRFIRGADTLDRTVMYHLETPAGIRPFYNILLAYPKKQSQEDLTILIQPGRLDSQPVRFTFSRKVLQQVPQLQYKQNN